MKHVGSHAYTCVATHGSSVEAIVCSPLIGDSRVMQHLRALVAKVAATPLPVLIQGPTGSGKELVARALHRGSGRAGAFVPFNVCAIAEPMFEDALFGHVRGAFTGAVAAAPGYLAEADRGTAFFDEISGLSLALQPKLLRAIETHEYRPVGAARDRRSEFRVVSATNEDLDQLVAQRRFREDLAERLRTVVLTAPPLCERLEDVPLLAQHFAARAHDGVARVAVAFTASALDALQSYAWPRNVRELRNVIERAIALRGGAVLDADAIIAALPHQSPRVPEPMATQREQLATVLRACDWDTALAARRLGVNRATVYRRMERLRLTRPRAPDSHSHAATANSHHRAANADPGVAPSSAEVVAL